MPGAQLNNKPVSAERFSECSEESQLELHLQRQLEEDVARIYDESIYSDLEVVCGKLKILTHSCILKARTGNFFRKLHKILHVNIERNTFDEIYSFISDVYTECNIQHEEQEIISYLERNLNVKEFTPDKHKEEEKSDVFSTPKCITPKEYYALVPIEENLLDKELIEQDKLSNAFHSIRKDQPVNTSQVNISQCNKPTSLPLNSSHTSKAVKHSSICDIFSKNCLKDNVSPTYRKNLSIVSDKDSKVNQTFNLSDTTESNTNIDKDVNNTNLGSEKQLDPPYSPDSLITDEPSSSSDYLSAAYTCSPGAGSSGFRVNIGNSYSKMENIYTLSDSGLEDTGMLGGVNSHKDVTLTTDDTSISAVSSIAEKQNLQKTKQTGTSSQKEFNGENINTEICGKSLKEEKQRQNEEIVILESSSLSSETGSWESVYPPKFVEKEICGESPLTDECRSYFQRNHASLPRGKLTLESMPCFIDASTLVDEDDTIPVESSANVHLETLRTPSQPVPCSTVKQDISPVDWSESNDNEDSLEQAVKKNPGSIQKDLSPTIFEMTPLTDDSVGINLCENGLEPGERLDESISYVSYIAEKERTHPAKTVLMANTPNNSIMSLKASKHYESENYETITVVDSPSLTKKLINDSNSPPILSGGVTVEDHLVQVGSSHESSSLPKFRLENMPIVTGAYLPQQTDHSLGKPRHNSGSAWVVDMSSEPKVDDNVNINSKSSDDAFVGAADKKNTRIFSMYIDLSEKTTLKEMPARLSSAMNTSAKKHSVSIENKSSSRGTKVTINTTDAKLTDTPVTTFEEYESLCNNPNISISEIISIPGKHKPLPELLEDSVIEEPSVNTARTVISEDKMTLEKELHHKESAPDLQAKDLFVKLSDLDKPVQKADMLLSIEAKEVDVRMTRSIPDWGEQAYSNNCRSIEIITSFHSENALSLNRLFPHLKNEFSRSMPGSLSIRTRAPLRLGTSSTLGDADEQVSEMSEISSMQSSNCRSGFGNSTTDSLSSSLIENCTSRLGQDLLRMFLEEIAPDVIVEVSGKRFKAHKCILSSRCQYFAGILSGGWVESLGNVIVLPPFSYNVVYFTLCHIYSGLATIPDSVSIVELATIADMLSLEGLKEAIMFTLKAKYCHHFHKPCTICVVGVLECFPLSSVYGLDDLYHKCLKWITKHFTKVWPTKAFATLPTDLLEKCYQHHVVNLTIDNVVDTVYGCGITAASLQNSRWSESVARICRRLIGAAAQFAAPKLVAVFKAIPPLPNEAPHAAKQALDECIAAAIEWGPPGAVCCAYGFLSALVKEMRNHQYAKPDLISNGTNSHKSFGADNLLYTQAGSWRLQCEGALVRASPRVVTTQAFKELPSELRKRLRELGCIKYGAHALPLTPPTPRQDKKCKSISQAKNSKVSTTSPPRNVDIAHVRAAFVPYSSKPMIPVTSTETLKSNNDLRDNRKSRVAGHPPKVRTTKAQEERAKFNKTKTTTSQDRLNSKMSGTRPPPFEKTKPRYLEPKSNANKKLAVNKHLPKIDSSSESSRNSSPVHSKKLRAGLQKGQRGGMEPQTMSQDSLATSSRPRTAEPSTDSLSESQTSNKFSTYTKAKHTKRPLESIQIPRHHVEPETRNITIKTKIPVCSNKNLKPKGIEYRNSREQKWGRMVVPKTNVHNNVGNNERKAPGSLMNATKSSSAKIVPKVVKEIPNNKMNTSKNQKSGHSSRHNCHQEEKENPPLREIPIMQRSGTFLKDEPTFGNKTTNIDIGQ